MPILSHSRGEERVIYEKLFSRFMNFLQRGDLTGCSNVIDIIYKAKEPEELSLRMALALSSSDTLMEQVAKESFKSGSYNNGDNVLHLVIRLSKSEAARQRKDSRGISKEIKFMHNMLGSVQFLRLLNKPNNSGISPLIEARHLGGLIFWNLRSLLLERLQEFEKPKTFANGRQGIISIGLGFMLVHSLEHTVSLIGAGLFVKGSVECYIAFTRWKDFRETARELSIY